MKTIICALAIALCAPAFGQPVKPLKYDFKLDAKREPVAQGMDLVDGAIVCPSMNEASWLFTQIDSARHARIALSPELRKQAALINGYDEGDEPRPSDYGCVLVPAGTELTVEPGNYVPVVSGKLPNGRHFKGVTLPSMVSH